MKRYILNEAQLLTLLVNQLQAWALLNNPGELCTDTEKDNFNKLLNDYNTEHGTCYLSLIEVAMDELRLFERADWL